MNLLIFAIGAMGYGYIEILSRGFTHWTMMLTGGACMLTLYYLNKLLRKKSLFLRALGGTFVITLYEFAVGAMVNLWYGWNVWDYSGLPGNLLGQICPKSTALWFLLCVVLFAVLDGLFYGYQRFQQFQQQR